MIGGLQGENGDLKTNFWRKNLKELVANIWKHSGGFRSHARWAAKFRKLKVSILQPKADFVASTLWFRSQRLISHSASCDWLPGYNFFISSSIHVPFEALDFWLPKIRNDIYYAWNRIHNCWNVSKSCCPLEFFMLDFSLCFPSLHSWFAFGKGL